MISPSRAYDRAERPFLIKASSFTLITQHPDWDRAQTKTKLPHQSVLIGLAAWAAGTVTGVVFAVKDQKHPHLLLASYPSLLLLSQRCLTLCYTGLQGM